MSVEIHRADPKFRRLAPALLLAVVLIAGGGIWGLQRWLDANPASVGGNGALMLAAALVVVLTTVSFGLAYSLWQEAARIDREDRFPPSDMRTLHDVPVRHGGHARRYAVWMRGGAVVATLAGMAILGWGYRLLTLVG